MVVSRAQVPPSPAPSLVSLIARLSTYSWQGVYAIYNIHICIYPQMATQIRYPEHSQEQWQHQLSPHAPLSDWSGWISTSKSKYICGRGMSPAAGLRHSVCPITGPYTTVSPVGGTWTCKPLQPQPHYGCWCRHSHPLLSLSYIHKRQDSPSPETWLQIDTGALSQLRAVAWRSIYPLGFQTTIPACHLIWLDLCQSPHAELHTHAHWSYWHRWHPYTQTPWSRDLLTGK